MDGTDLNFAGKKRQDFRIYLKRIYRAADMIRHCKINFGYDYMRTWKNRKIETLIFNFTTHISGVLTLNMFFHRFKINKLGGDDQKNDEHTQKKSSNTNERV